MKRLVLLVALVFPLLASCSTPENVLSICSSLPLRSGDGENPRGVAMSRSIEMAIADQGTVTFGGQTYTLRYVPMDDTTPERGSWDPAQEEKNARAAIAEHDCIAYIGTYNSGAAKVSMPILNRAQMLMISPGNTYPGLTKPDTGIGDEPWIYSPLGPENRNYCRVVPADDLQAPAAARYAIDTLNVQKVYIFHDTEVYGRGLAELFAQTMRDAGVEIVGGEPVGVGARTVNVSTFASDIALEEPDLVYFGGTANDTWAAVLRDLRTEGYDGYFMGADGMAEADFISEANAFNDNHVLATLVGLPPSELGDAGQTWRSNYIGRYDDDPDPFAAPSYEAARVVIAALESTPFTGSISDADFLPRARLAVLTTVKGIQRYDGILGTWGFDENCDTTSTTISLNRVANGDFVFDSVIE